MRPVLGHLQWARLGQIEDLAGDRRSRLGRVQKRRAASLAGSRHVVLHPIRVIAVAQRLALMAGLPAGLAARFAAQASGSPLRPRLLQPIARRRLATVAAVEAKTALQLLDALDETRDLLFQPRVLLPKPSVFLSKPGVLLFQMGDLLCGRFGRCPRRRAARRLGIAHAAVESFPEIPVNPFTPIPTETRLNSLAQNDKSDDLGSYRTRGQAGNRHTRGALRLFRRLELRSGHRSRPRGQTSVRTALAASGASRAGSKGARSTAGLSPSAISSATASPVAGAFSIPHTLWAVAT